MTRARWPIERTRTDGLDQAWVRIL